MDKRSGMSIKKKSGINMDKIGRLRSLLKSLKRVVVAYSGGVDSTFLLKMSIDTLGKENVIAVTARSETYPMSEYKDAKSIARGMGARHIVIDTEELGIKNFKNNPVDRCYYCKRELFSKLSGIMKRYKFAAVLDGTNHDDLKDIRYGRKAAKELGVVSPLLEAGIGKGLIRRRSKIMRLVTWQKPSYACLASRIPFHDGITPAALSRVDKAEAYLRSLGFRQIRVRSHKDTARLEFYRSDFEKILGDYIRGRVVSRLKRLGFKYVSLDLEGYRTGSMHEAV